MLKQSHRLPKVMVTYYVSPSLPPPPCPPTKCITSALTVALKRPLYISLRFTEAKINTNFYPTRKH